MSMRARNILMPTVIAFVLACCWWLAPQMGTDLSAQIERAAFFADHGFSLIDFSWYAGTQPLGYSLVAPPLMALIGVGATGVLAATVSAGLFAWLLHRHEVARPVLGSLAGAVTMVGGLVAGRVTFGLGVAFGLAALTFLHASKRWVALTCAGGFAALAGLTSPVAGLFTGVAGVTLLLATRHRAEGIIVAVWAGVGMGITAVPFGDGGWMNFSTNDFWHAFIATLAVIAVATWARSKPIVIGGALTAAGLIASVLIRTPVGSNAVRATLLLALPLILALLPTPWTNKWLRTGVLATAALVVTWWLPPFAISDIRAAGDPAASADYYTPLLTELERHTPIGRIEIPSTKGNWEAAFVAEHIPLARGWLRQLDIEHNPLFFTTLPDGEEGTDVPLNADTYRAWLHDNGVEYVAVPDTTLSWVGRAEARLINKGLPYLTKVWSSPDWVLYEVTDSPGIIDAPATLIASDSTGITFDAPTSGNYLVRVRPLPWLTITGPGDVQWRAQDAWTLITIDTAGRYTVGSG